MLKLRASLLLASCGWLTRTLLQGSVPDVDGFPGGLVGLLGVKGVDSPP